MYIIIVKLKFLIQFSIKMYIYKKMYIIYLKYHCKKLSQISNNNIIFCFK